MRRGSQHEAAVISLKQTTHLLDTYILNIKYYCQGVIKGRQGSCILPLRFEWSLIISFVENNRTN
jgi:hypothetical protein